jgi:cobyrinic acid a,c-diamide synthase
VIPRIVIAGTSSGTGKTTVTSGVIAALRARGHIVQPFKVGPDYIDPSYHSLASGRPGRNLDAFLSGPELIAPLVRHGGTGADIAVIEGVMGLFDGASGQTELASTAHVAKLIDAPVVLVVDASAMARSAAAVIHGFRSFDPDVDVAGVIFNRVGSKGHAELLQEAAAAVPGKPLHVLGALLSEDRIAVPERHLGLVPVAEREWRGREALAVLAEAVAAQVDLEALVRLARTAPAAAGPSWSPEPGDGVLRAGRKVPIAIARGPAFSFHYEENLELLAAAGAELAPFDPTTDRSLPEGSDALILAGGFPEAFSAELAANTPMRADVAKLAAAGRPILAECGGLLYLADGLDGYSMCGVLPVRGSISDKLTLGYRDALAITATPWLPAGTRVRGHEFHCSQIEPSRAAGAAAPAWSLAAHGHERSDGYVSGSVQAGYLHVHWAAHPEIPRAFVAAAAARR